MNEKESIFYISSIAIFVFGTCASLMMRGIGEESGSGHWADTAESKKALAVIQYYGGPGMVRLALEA